MNPTTIQDPLLKTAERLMKMKVTPSQVSILLHLSESVRHVTINKLAERADLTTNGLTYHVLKLIESGHVERDGQNVKLTRRGRVHAKSLCEKVEFGRAA